MGQVSAWYVYGIYRGRSARLGPYRSEEQAQIVAKVMGGTVMSSDDVARRALIESKEFRYKDTDTYMQRDWKRWMRRIETISYILRW